MEFLNQLRGYLEEISDFSYNRHRDIYEASVDAIKDVKQIQIKYAAEYRLKNSPGKLYNNE